MLTKIKAKVQLIIAGQAKIANKIGLTPNIISAIGAALALLSAAAYANGHKFLIPAVISMLLSGYCDILDGALARLYGKETPFGGFLDSLLDRYSDALIYAGVILGGLCSPMWGLAALVGSLLVSYSRARAEALSVKMETVGVAERAERIIILATTSIMEIFWAGALEVGIILLAILTNLTVIQRSSYVYKILKKRGNTAN